MEEDLLHITDTWMLMLMLMLPYVACFFGLHYMLVHAVALCRPLQARRAGRGALAKGTLHLDGPQSTVGPCQQQLLLMQQLFTERGGGAVATCEAAT